MKNFFIISFTYLLSCSVQCVAQEIVLTTGGNYSGSNGSVTFSIGQVSYTSYNDFSGSANLGVQQPYEFFIQSIKNTSKEINILVYPNPTTDRLTIELSEWEAEYVSVIISDILGNIILEDGLVSATNTFSLKELPSAIYLLSIQQKNKTIQTLKIEKE